MVIEDDKVYTEDRVKVRRGAGLGRIKLGGDRLVVYSTGCTSYPLTTKYKFQRLYDRKALRTV